MAFYLVRARIMEEERADFLRRLAGGDFKGMRHFGPALTHSLLQARWNPETGETMWEEECYCRPPLAEERAMVLDQYFAALHVEQVPEGDGWRRIGHLPLMWPASA